MSVVLPPELLGLKKHSNAAFIDAPEHEAAFREKRPDLRVFSIRKSEPVPPHGWGYELGRQFTGKILTKRPRYHFQIDAIFVGPDADPTTVAQVSEFAHVGGWIWNLANGETKPTRHTPSPPWSSGVAKLSTDEQKYLFDEIAKLPAGSVYVEIGTYRGGGAALAASANSKIKIFAMDIWEEMNPSFDHFERHTQFFKNVIPMRVDRNNPTSGPKLIAKRLGIDVKDLRIDLIFVDGAHDYKSVLGDLTAYDPYAKKICGHDWVYGWQVDLALRNFYAGRSGPFRNWGLAVKGQAALFKVFRKLPNPYVELAPGKTSIWVKRPGVGPTAPALETPARE